MYYRHGKNVLHQHLILMFILMVCLLIPANLFGQIKRISTIDQTKARTVSTQKKDTTAQTTRKVQTAKPAIMTPQTNQSKTVQPAEQKREVIGTKPPQEIIGRRPVLLKPFPDSLQLGAYVLVVEKFEPGGIWNETDLTCSSLNGIGFIRMKCPEMLTIVPGLWKDAHLKPVSFRVVETVRNPEREISLEDASKLELQQKTGSDVEIMMPHVNNKAVKVSDYMKEMVKLKTDRGIPVRFNDLTVKVAAIGDKKGTVLSGNAKFPVSDDAVNAPYNLNIYPGFTLKINEITFTPKLEPLMKARLELPVSITSGTACGRSYLNMENIRLSARCEFYHEFPNENFGTFGIGNTQLTVNGKGYIVDFSSTKSYAASGKPASWKGVVLMNGESAGMASGSVTSNTGFLYGYYGFTNGLIESSGMAGTFTLKAPYSYETLQPMGYTLAINTATVNVSASQIAGGELRNGTVTLPRTAVRQANDAPVVLNDISMTIKPSLDVQGYAIVEPSTSVYWGDLTATGGGDMKAFGAAGITRQVCLFFAAQPRPPFNPVAADGKSFNFPNSSITAALTDSFNMQGATFGRFTELVVHTPDRPGGSGIDPNKPETTVSANKVWYRFTQKDNSWINVVTEGVICHIDGHIQEPPYTQLGDDSKALYVGEKPFKIISNDEKESSTILLQCMESAVLKCDYRSLISLPDPVDNVLKFSEMVFTSTANNAGGKLTLSANDSLSYWGLGLVPKSGFSNAGLVSVKTGQIIMTASGLSEKVHFAQPFWINWGELLACGKVGNFYFDYNSAGQQFDKFNYIHNAVSLSGVNPDPSQKGFLRVGGNAYFPFFGSNYLHIKDIFTPVKTGHPHYRRTIELSDETLANYLPTNYDINGNWLDGHGIFNFKIRYADVTQDGFLGDGTSALKVLEGGALSSTLDMNSRGTCIRIGSDLYDMRSVAMGPVGNISSIRRIWGCVCLNGDAIENIVVGGEVTDASNMSIVARAGNSLIAIMQLTPSFTKYTLDGVAYMSVMAGLDVMMKGHMQLMHNFGKNYIEGEIAGKFRAIEGAVLVGSSVEAEGQLNWHLGADFNELQGMVSVSAMSSFIGTGIVGGFYIGVNAPKERAWVLIGADPRYNLNMTPMPSRLTGVYGFVNIKQGINLYIISGGYELFLGFGAFMNPIPVPLVVGNLGGRIYGEILGGLVSASAYFNLQLLLGNPIGFEGTVGLEACVLWVICGSVDLTVGLNSVQGFYIR